MVAWAPSQLESADDISLILMTSDAMLAPTPLERFSCFSFQDQWLAVLTEEP
jgi:hypothetical protein